MTLNGMQSEMLGFLWVSWSLLVLGILCVLSRRNLVGVLFGIELMLNGSALNFATFSFFKTGTIDGQLFSLFIIVVAAAETAVALGIILAFYRQRQSVKTDEANWLRN